ncbi:MAG: hypothetical protein JW832_01665 [Deltaproteobacteria bacterium]|nr:hypothetical protein [Deltaproteobacteria bacterium]
MLLQNNAGAIKSQKGYAPITDKKKADGVKRPWLFAVKCAKSFNCRSGFRKQLRCPLCAAAATCWQVNAVGCDLPAEGNCGTFFIYAPFLPTKAISQLCGKLQTADKNCLCKSFRLTTPMGLPDSTSSVKNLYRKQFL